MWQGDALTIWSYVSSNKILTTIILKYFHINNIKFNYDLEFKNKLNKKKMCFINKHIIQVYCNFIFKKKNSKIKTANITVNDIKLFFALFGIILNDIRTKHLMLLCRCAE